MATSPRGCTTTWAGGATRSGSITRICSFPANSFNRWVGINSPKATLAIVPPDRLAAAVGLLQFGPDVLHQRSRGSAPEPQQGSLVSQAHAYQLVVSKTILDTDFRVTLGHVTQEASLAKIDPDTGLAIRRRPEPQSVCHRLGPALFSPRAAAGLRSRRPMRAIFPTARPLPEAPRLIFDVLGTLDRLPFHLHARAEFEEVGRKPLGDGFVSVPVREFRGALVRPFRTKSSTSAFTFRSPAATRGQTTEVLALPGEGEPFERVVGVFIPSYATASVSYHFGERGGVRNAERVAHGSCKCRHVQAGVRRRGGCRCRHFVRRDVLVTAVMRGDSRLTLMARCRAAPHAIQVRRCPTFA